jgi:hypothetical protein
MTLWRKKHTGRALGTAEFIQSLEKAMQPRPTLQKRGPHKNSLPIEDKSFGARVSGQEDVKKLIWPKSKLMQNVCRRPSDRLLGILARLFLEPKFPHTDFSISSHLPVTGLSSSPGCRHRLRLLSNLLHIPKWRGSKESAVFAGEL